jgi:hypothetical protein
MRGLTLKRRPLGGVGIVRAEAGSAGDQPGLGTVGDLEL